MTTESSNHYDLIVLGAALFVNVFPVLKYILE